jgi:hypothetical protein
MYKVIAGAVLVLSLIGAGGATPLISPPPQMTRLDRDPMMISQMRRMGGLTFVYEYRGYVHQKQGVLVYGRSVALALGKANNPMGLSAVDYGKHMFDIISGRPGFKVVSSGEVALCNGHRGWFHAFTAGNGDLRLEQVYGQSADATYVAVTMRPARVSDPFNTHRYLLTLCPPGQPPEAASATAFPFAPPPSGWSRVAPPAGRVMPPDVAAGMWVHFAKGEPFAQTLLLITGTGLSSRESTERVVQGHVNFMRAHATGFTLGETGAQKRCGGTEDGWFLTYSTARSTIEESFAFSSEIGNVLSYTRAAGTPENAAAGKSLQSLCAR